MAIKRRLEVDFNGDDDRKELQLVIPSALKETNEMEMFAGVFHDSLKSLVNWRVNGHEKDAVIVGTEPEFNPEIAERLADFLRKTLPVAGFDLPVEVRDIVRELDLTRDDVEITLGDDENAQEALAFLLKSLRDSISGLLEESTVIVQESEEEKNKDRDCGCPMCYLYRRVKNIAEPDEYLNGEPPASFVDRYSDQEWQTIDRLHDRFVKEGRLSPDAVKPSEFYRTPRH